MAFGLLLGLVGCAIAGKEKISRDVEDDMERKYARLRGDLTYRDSYGREHLVSNNRRVMTTTSVTGNSVVIQDVKTGKTYYNLTDIRNANLKKSMELRDARIRKEKEDENGKIIAEAIRDGKKYYYINVWDEKKKVWDKEPRLVKTGERGWIESTRSPLQYVEFDVVMLYKEDKKYYFDRIENVRIRKQGKHLREDAYDKYVRLCEGKWMYNGNMNKKPEMTYEEFIKKYNL